MSDRIILLDETGMSSGSSDSEFSSAVHLRSSIKKKLTCQVFVGSYLEKRFCEQLNVYKDVVTINDDEKDFKKTLDTVSRELLQIYPQEVIATSITYSKFGDDVKPEYRIWTNFTDVPVGLHWFKIEKVLFTERGMILTVQCLRPYVSENANISTSSLIDFSLPDFLTLISVLFSTLVTNIQHFFQNVDRQSVTEALRFLVTFLLVFITGSFQFFQFACDFLLKFMHELSILIDKLTPIVIALIDTISKLIGGFYLLILSMWRMLLQKQHNPPREEIPKSLKNEFFSDKRSPRYIYPSYPENNQR